ncbi:MAG: GntR family transcriptional regulator [Oscillospiraceae bacterium]|nr:GntR family transcriptional regulator [Oscillospiraceae bacterium]MDY3791856.1 GntR family transcriptional regulator [Oscillospiraceae bacterium]MDY6208226.1 GntR family transcriptional regulator [Oscillospiraceae bacterium]
MHWVFTPDAPIYLQVVRQLEQMIASGMLAPGDRLLSVRDFASQANVNPNTMQKALTELENRGIVYSKRTSGRFITDDPERISKLREELAEKEITAFLGAMKRLGYSESEAARLISEKNSGREQTEQT